MLVCPTAPWGGGISEILIQGKGPSPRVRQGGGMSKEYWLFETGAPILTKSSQQILFLKNVNLRLYQLTSMLAGEYVTMQTASMCM